MFIIGNITLRKINLTFYSNILLTETFTWESFPMIHHLFIILWFNVKYVKCGMGLEAKQLCCAVGKLLSIPATIFFPFKY